MPDTPNPYAVSEQAIDPTFALGPQVGEAVMVNQVTVVGILQIGQGILEIMMGGFMIAAGFFMATALKMQPPQGGQPPPEMFTAWIQGFYWILGGVIALFAVMRIFSGIGSFWFRGRLWMLVSLFGGLISVFTCYCAPFSIGLCIYGLIVMFNSGVAKAYRMGRQRVPPAEIKRSFAMAEYGQLPLPPSYRSEDE